MRPCGPVRHSWAPRREVTKKELYHLLADGRLTITVVTANVEIPYDGTLARLRSALRSGKTDVDQANSRSPYSKDGYRTIVMTGSDIAPRVLMRMEC